MTATFSPPALGASGAVATQPSASDTAVHGAEFGPGKAQKTGHKPTKHKKKNSSFGRKVSAQVKKMRAKLPAFLNSFDKGKSEQ